MRLPEITNSWLTVLGVLKLSQKLHLRCEDKNLLKEDPEGPDDTPRWAAIWYIGRLHRHLPKECLNSIDTLLNSINSIVDNNRMEIVRLFTRPCRRNNKMETRLRRIIIMGRKMECNTIRCNTVLLKTNYIRSRIVGRRSGKRESKCNR